MIKMEFSLDTCKNYLCWIIGVLIVIIIVTLIIEGLHYEVTEGFSNLTRQKIFARGSKRVRDDKKEGFTVPRSSLITSKYFDKLKSDDQLKTEGYCSSCDSGLRQSCQTSKPTNGINNIDKRAAESVVSGSGQQLNTKTQEAFATSRITNKFDMLKTDATSSHVAQQEDPSNIGMKNKVQQFIQSLKN